MKIYDTPDYDNEFTTTSSLLSNCCGHPPMGELDNNPKGYPITGICARCQEHAVFTQEPDDKE